MTSILYQDLTEAERRVWDGFIRGERVDLGGPDPRDGLAVYPPESEVRSEVIMSLLLGAVPGSQGTTMRLLLAGALIKGELNFDDAAINYSFALQRCTASTIDLGDARTRGVWITKCTIEAIGCNGLNVDGPLVVKECIVEHYIELNGAVIAGRVDLSGTVFGARDQVSLSAVGLSVGQSCLYPSRQPKEAGLISDMRRLAKLSRSSRARRASAWTARAISPLNQQLRFATVSR